MKKKWNSLPWKKCGRQYRQTADGGLKKLIINNSISDPRYVFYLKWNTKIN